MIDERNIGGAGGLRLFTAVLFDSDTLNYIEGIQNSLKRYIQKGSFVVRDNLHMTLAFIGQTPRDSLAAARSALDSILCAPFEIELGGIGSFRRKGICFLEAAHSADLERLALNIGGSLKDSGFHIEDRPFRPHITLVRAAAAVTAVERETPRRLYLVRHISLMLSERTQSGISYKEIYRKNLK